MVQEPLVDPVHKVTVVVAEPHLATSVVQAPIGNLVQEVAVLMVQTHLVTTMIREPGPVNNCGSGWASLDNNNGSRAASKSGPRNDSGSDWPHLVTTVVWEPLILRSDSRSDGGSGRVSFGDNSGPRTTNRPGPRTDSSSSQASLDNYSSLKATSIPVQNVTDLLSEPLIYQVQKGTLVVVEPHLVTIEAQEPLINLI